MNFNNNMKGLSAIGISDILGTGATAFFWFFLASLISPEQYGEIFYYLGIATIASSFVLLGTQNTITVYLAKKIKLQSTLYLVSLLAAFFASIIIMIWFYRLDIGFVLIGYVINTLAIGGLLGKKLFKSYSKFVIIQKILVVILGLGFFYIFGTDGILFAIALSYISYTIIIFKGMRADTVNFSLLKKNIGFVTNNYSISIVQILRTQIDKIIIPAILSFTILGNFALALQVMTILNFLPNTVYKFILPHDANGNPNSKIKIITIIVSVGFAISGLILSPIIIPNLFPEYIQAIEAIQIMSITAIPTSITIILTSKFLGLEKSRYVLISRIISLSLISSCMIILGTFFEIIGLAFAYLIANSASALFLLISNYLIVENKNKSKFNI